MSLDNLARKLRRDLGANPKKAAILGVMLLVAAYFWAPLLISKRESTVDGPTAAASQVNLKDDPLLPGQGQSNAKETIQWEKVRQEIAADPRMLSAVLPASAADPFLPRVAVVAPIDPEPVEEEPVVSSEPLPPQLSPKDAGITIASVLIGPRRRAVIVNGDVYQLGERIRVATGEDDLVTEFRLTRIEATTVEVECNGVRYSLEVARPRLAKGDRIGRETGRSAP